MSPNTQRVMVALAEKGLKYELKQVHVMESEHKVRKNHKIILSSILIFSRANIWKECNLSVSFLYLSMKTVSNSTVSKYNSDESLLFLSYDYQ